jgi:hypothetical protein
MIDKELKNDKSPNSAKSAILRVISNLDILSKNLLGENSDGLNMCRRLPK